MKRRVHKNFLKLTGKHLCQSFFFNKVAGLRPMKVHRKFLGVAFIKKVSKANFLFKTVQILSSEEITT